MTRSNLGCHISVIAEGVTKQHVYRISVIISNFYMKKSALTDFKIKGERRGKIYNAYVMKPKESVHNNLCKVAFLPRNYPAEGEGTRSVKLL